MSLADDGSRRIRESARAVALDGEVQEVRVGRTRIGFTPPTLIYEQMRRIDASSTSLDADIRVNVADLSVQTSWKRWLEEWRAFYKRSMSFGNKLGAIFWTEDIVNTTNGYDHDLQGWYAKYAAQKTPLGEPVPAPSDGAGPPEPMRHGPGSEKDAPTSLWAAIPWYAYVITVGVVGAIGYSFYRAAKHAKEQEDYLIRNVVPNLLPRYGRDPAPPEVVVVSGPPAPPQAASAPAAVDPNSLEGWFS